MSFHVPGPFRIVSGRMASDRSYGNNGAFLLPATRDVPRLFCIASDGAGWEHVSVSIYGTRARSVLPNWTAMCRVRDLFWDRDDCVAQFHPPRAQYVDFAQVLHLWRPVGVQLPMPHAWMVGPTAKQSVADCIREVDEAIEAYGQEKP